jgi:alkaline phosphatase D
MDIPVNIRNLKPMHATKMLLIGVLAAGCLPAANAQTKVDFSQPGVVSKIAFGSCFNPRDKDSSIFGGIISHKPDVFVFLGDNIYGDTDNMDVLREKYAEFEAVEGFRNLRDSTNMIATWDDHDYGRNDGGKSYPMRKESERIFLDFFKDPQDSPRRGRDGVYGSYSYGPPGKTCQILLLDTRFFRDELPRAKGKPAKGTVGWYEPTDDTSKTLLGEEQWNWLESQLQVPADIRIIASSIQVIAVEKGMENWGNVPHEQKRLFDLLKKHKANHTFAISGDVHFSELSKKEVDGYPFHDFTSSGLSHTSKGWALAGNSFRIGESHWEFSAGLIEIDWEAQTVGLSAINPKGEKISENTLKLSELKFP